MLKAIGLFLLAGLAEIGGGYLIWLWLREGKPAVWGLMGGFVLFLYGVIATLKANQKQRVETNDHDLAGRDPGGRWLGNLSRSQSSD
ncbi:hypothetical protein [Melghirimyces profundicolus]|uniref:hypothetical protein n=1 Tax=Melghirimyces profundicolus TaxID=1242148 RepID=UPI000D359077|nr:hypothetical protein [Melghirimyces profundicolus]